VKIPPQGSTSLAAAIHRRLPFRTLPYPGGKNDLPFLYVHLGSFPLSCHSICRRWGVPLLVRWHACLCLDVTFMPGLESSCHSSGLRTNRPETAGRSQFNDQLAGRPTPGPASWPLGGRRAARSGRAAGQLAAAPLIDPSVNDECRKLGRVRSLTGTALETKNKGNKIKRPTSAG